jgi:hypothetical protein
MSQLRSKYRRDVKRDKLYQIVLKEKIKGCSICGEKDVCCIDMHHVDSEEKDAAINDLIRLRVEPHVLILELNKCIPVCRNCHAKIHASDMRGTQNRPNQRSKVNPGSKLGTMANALEVVMGGSVTVDVLF